MNGERGRTGIFVSYSHKDREWLDRLRVHLVPYLRGEKQSFWDDSQIRPGQSWREEIQRAMQTVRVAILLVSPDFPASDFIANVELPTLLKEAKGSVTLLWVPVRAAAWEATPLRDFQAAWDPRRPLASLRPAQRDEALVTIARSAGAAAGVSALAIALRIADDFEPEVNAFVKGQPEPEAFRRSEVPGQTERSVSSDPAAFVDDLADPRNGNVQIPREPVDTQPQWFHEFFLQDFAGVNRW